MSKYEVQENCLCGGWTNTWSHEDWAGKDIPTTFDSREDAEAELDWFFQECQEAVDSGNMEDVPDRADFRIVEVSDDFYDVQAINEERLLNEELENWVRNIQN